MEIVSKPVNSFNANHSLQYIKYGNRVQNNLSNHHAMLSDVIEELFVKLPKDDIQNEIIIIWKDLKIISIDLFDMRNGSCCFRDQFYPAVSIHTLIGMQKGRYLAKLTLNNGATIQRILVLL